MMKKTKLAVLVLWAGLFASAASAITGTTSLQATFISTIEAGTCMAQIRDAAGKQISTLAFGDVFKSDLTAKSRSEPFSIAFTDCAGVKSATVQAQKGAGGGCSGGNSDGDSFAAGNATAFEIWQGIAGAGTLLSCNNPTNQNVIIHSGAGGIDLAARIVVAHGWTVEDVTTGNVSAPVTFVITYQ